jgi:hypothetical protein
VTTPVHGALSSVILSPQAKDLLVRATVQASGGSDNERSDVIQSPEDESRCLEPLLWEILRLRAQDDEGEGLTTTKGSQDYGRVLESRREPRMTSGGGSEGRWGGLVTDAARLAAELQLPEGVADPA